MNGVGRGELTAVKNIILCYQKKFQNEVSEKKQRGKETFVFVRGLGDYKKNKTAQIKATP